MSAPANDRLRGGGAFAAARFGENPAGLPLPRREAPDTLRLPRLRQALLVDRRRPGKPLRAKAGRGGQFIDGYVHTTVRTALQNAVKKRLIPYNPARDADISGTGISSRC